MPDENTKTRTLCGSRDTPCHDDTQFNASNGCPKFCDEIHGDSFKRRYNQSPLQLCFRWNNLYADLVCHAIGEKTANDEHVEWPSLEFDDRNVSVSGHLALLSDQAREHAN